MFLKRFDVLYKTWKCFRQNAEAFQNRPFILSVFHPFSVFKGAKKCGKNFYYIL